MSDSIEQLRAENQRLTAQLRRLGPLASLGELTGTATHEFNNVLMTVLNYGKLGLRNRDDASRDKAFTKIIAASERAASIASVILAQSRGQSDGVRPVDLAQLIGTTMVLLERELQKFRVAVETSFDVCPPIAGRGNDLQRLLINLVINARQAMEGGGTLFLGLQADGQRVQLTVRDSGCGIDAATLPRIFDARFSTKTGPDETGCGGTGLGLSACKTILQQHAAGVRVESTPGRGTAFVMSFPVAAAAEAA